MSSTNISVPESVDALLQLMVRFDTVNAALGGRPQPEGELSEALQWLAERWGFETRRLPVPGQVDNLLVSFTPRPGEPALLFDSHLDTVGVGDMTIEPFGAEVRDGRMYGRGTCDTKASGAAMLWALRQYAETGPHPRNVSILFSVDEESGMTGIQAMLERELPGMDPPPIGVVVGEPTELHTVIAHNGIIRFRLIAHGKAAHSSVPHEGRSAISMMLPAVSRVENEYAPSLTAEHPLTGVAVCTVNVIRGGTAVNVIPAHCEVEIDRRLVPGEDADQVVPAVMGLARKTIESSGNGDMPAEEAFSYEMIANHPPLEDKGNEALAELAVKALKRLGWPAMTVGAPFGTHAGFCSRAGLPAIVLGPGSSAPAHQSVEWVDLDQVHKGVELYLEMMRSGEE